MYIYPGLGFIYIRVPRTGSTSFVSSFKGGEMVGRMHGTVYEDRPYCPDDVWKRYKKIAFVRHPEKWVADQFLTHRTGHALISQFKSTKPDLDEFIKGIPLTPYDWMIDSAGSLMVDEILRTEDLSEIFTQHKVNDVHLNKTKNRKLEFNSVNMASMHKKFYREYRHYG